MLRGLFFCKIEDRCARRKAEQSARFKFHFGLSSSCSETLQGGKLHFRRTVLIGEVGHYPVGTRRNQVQKTFTPCCNLLFVSDELRDALGPGYCAVRLTRCGLPRWTANYEGTLWPRPKWFMCPRICDNYPSFGPMYLL